MDHRTRACAIANDLQYAPIGRATRMLVSALDDARDEGAAVMAGILALGAWAAERAAADAAVTNFVTERCERGEHGDCLSYICGCECHS